MDLNNISFGKPVLDSGNTGKPDSLVEIGREKISSLKSAIVEIETLIFEREALSRIFSDEIEKIKTSIENFLLKNVAVDSEDFKERNGLRQKQIEVSELALNERVNCWRDVALLKKELREYKKELSEKEERMKMFNDILDDSKGLKGGSY
ncbi:MAG: hypothetical protein OQK82_06020 [Candidatus Pacearchaeota archaeon]|nr:hypothetical protein [Candidatus Pacearchaeota archaeon]